MSWGNAYPRQTMKRERLRLRCLPTHKLYWENEANALVQAEWVRRRALPPNGDGTKEGA